MNADKNPSIEDLLKFLDTDIELAKGIDANNADLVPLQALRNLCLAQVAVRPQIKIGATGILCDSGQILLGRRNATDTAGGLWVTPGGGIELGESVDEAIVREFMEETGLRVVVSTDYLNIQQRIAPNGRAHNIMIFKSVRWVNGSKMPMDGLDRVEWFCREEIEKMIVDRTVTPMTARALVEYYTAQNPK